MSPTDDPELVRYEEHLHVSTETVPVETVRIEKVIVTETRTFTADVRREELRITRAPITSQNSLPPAPSNAPTLPIVIVLREEQLTLTTTIVPVEKITVNVANVISEQHVNEPVRHEHIDVIDHRLPGPRPCPG